VFERKPSVVLEPPSALRQRPPVGQSVTRVLDPANGDLSTNVQISATSAVNPRQRTEAVFAWRPSRASGTPR
jgi:hypothetical protein